MEIVMILGANSKFTVTKANQQKKQLEKRAVTETFIRKGRQK